jgi:hypothetical protein
METGVVARLDEKFLNRVLQQTLYAFTPTP